MPLEFLVLFYSSSEMMRNFRTKAETARCNMQYSREGYHAHKAQPKAHPLIKLVTKVSTRMDSGVKVIKLPGANVLLLFI